MISSKVFLQDYFRGKQSGWTYLELRNCYRSHSSSKDWSPNLQKKCLEWFNWSKVDTIEQKLAQDATQWSYFHLTEGTHVPRRTCFHDVGQSCIFYDHWLGRDQGGSLVMQRSKRPQSAFKPSVNNCLSITND